MARTGRSSKELETDLAAYANAFADWRYVFEGTGQQVRVNLLVAFAKALYEEALALNPGWAIRADKHDRLTADNERPTMTVMNLGGGTFLNLVDGTIGVLNTPEPR